jgi:hypothetical protein
MAWALWQDHNHRAAKLHLAFIEHLQYG